MRETTVSSSEIVSMVGGVLVIISTLLPWYHTIMTSPLPNPAFVKSVLGIETISGKIVFALGIVSLGVLFIPRYKIRSVLTVTFGLIISLVGWYDLYTRTRNTGVHLRVVVDIGFFLVVIDSIILLIGGLIDFWKHGSTLRAFG